MSGVTTLNNRLAVVIPMAVVMPGAINSALLIELIQKGFALVWR